jgi:dTDP-4-amino-4,6-dideoxygalactose transaminase
LSEAYASDRQWGSFPITEQSARTHLSLPIGPHLSPQACDRLVEALRDYVVRA